MRLHNICHRRHRHRKNAVLASYGSPSLAQERYNRLRDIQIVQTYRRCHNVHDGIHRADLMEVYLILRDAVSLCLRFCQNPEDFHRRLLCSFGDGSSGNDIQYFRKPSVLMVVMVFMGMGMCVRMFLCCGMAMDMFHLCGRVLMMGTGMFFLCRIIMVMGMSSLLRMLMMMLVPVQIFHVMVMVFMPLVQLHVEVAGVQPRFFHPADFYLKALHRKAL